MPSRTAVEHNTTSEAKAPRKRSSLPPKGTAARLLHAAGLWSHMSPEEIEHIKKEIFTSRRSSR